MLKDLDNLNVDNWQEMVSKAGLFVNAFIYMGSKLIFDE